jgi:hypothetical protein
LLREDERIVRRLSLERDGRLKKINGALYEMGGKYFIFGCNGLIVVVIAIFTIFILMLF